MVEDHSRSGPWVVDCMLAWGGCRGSECFGVEAGEVGFGSSPYSVDWVSGFRGV